MIQKQTIGNATLYCGDALTILSTLEPGYDALITDPPYSSGGLHKGSRNLDPEKKYINSDRYISFSGDNRDQRSWQAWSVMWASQAIRKIKNHGYIMMFTDWRQLPATTDVMQHAGAHWRGIVSWDKTESSRAPHKGYFRHQCEYIVWGSVGSLKKCTHAGPFSGVIRERVNPKEKLHMTGKPVNVMDKLIQPLEDNAHVLDPFMGSATTALPILKRGGKFTGIEISSEYFDIACQRIEDEFKK